jgi:hypothetical protein
MCWDPGATSFAPVHSSTFEHLLPRSCRRSVCLVRPPRSPPRAHSGPCAATQTMSGFVGWTTMRTDVLALLQAHVRERAAAVFRLVVRRRPSDTLRWAVVLAAPRPTPWSERDGAIVTQADARRCPGRRRSASHDVPAFVVFHTAAVRRGPVPHALVARVHARSTMRPEHVRGPIERNGRPENVSLSGLGPGLASDLAPWASSLLAAGLLPRASPRLFAADFAAAGSRTGASKCARMRPRAGRAARATRRRKGCVGDRMTLHVARSWWRWGATDGTRAVWRGPGPVSGTQRARRVSTFARAGHRRWPVSILARRPGCVHCADGTPPERACPPTPPAWMRTALPARPLGRWTALAHDRRRRRHRHLPHRGRRRALAAAPGWCSRVWLAGGLLVLAGALAYAEMGAMYPRAGRPLPLLREPWGPLPAFPLRLDVPDGDHDRRHRRDRGRLRRLLGALVPRSRASARCGRGRAARERRPSSPPCSRSCGSPPRTTSACARARACRTCSRW